jgi:hypothetical protein
MADRFQNRGLKAAAAAKLTAAMSIFSSGPATVRHHRIDDDVRLMQETTAMQPSQRLLTQNI